MSNPVLPAPQAAEHLTSTTVAPQHMCAKCAGEADTSVATKPSHVYALGRIEPRFPRLAVEKELAQVVGREATAGLTDRQAIHSALSKRENRYLARKMCWVFTVEGIPTYLLRPRDPADFELLVEALRPNPRRTDVDLVIGLRGDLAQPDACNGLLVPIVAFDQLYSFDLDGLIAAIPRPEGAAKEKLGPVAEEVLERILQMADNAGATDAHRALNYLAVRYPRIYSLAVELHEQSRSLSGVETRPSAVSSTRAVLDVIFSYTNRTTDVTERYFTRVDVTEEFPFLVTKLGLYLDR
jgi:hypothetical protein